MRLLLVPLAAVVLLGAACGNDDTATAADGGEPVRTVEVEMRDIAFAPTTLSVRKGETVRFVFANKGAVVHDAFIGDATAQAEHEKEMQGAAAAASDTGHGEHGSEEPAVTVDPGRRAELTHTFDDAGTIEIGCHQPGHYAAGMKVAVSVA